MRNPIRARWAAWYLYPDMTWGEMRWSHRGAVRAAKTHRKHYGAPEGGIRIERLP